MGVPVLVLEPMEDLVSREDAVCVLDEVDVLVEL
jgi:hypothetical protein